VAEYDFVVHNLASGSPTAYCDWKTKFQEGKMSDTESIRAEIRSIVSSASGDLADWMGDLNIGEINGEIKKDCSSPTEATSMEIALYSSKAIVGVFDEEDLCEAYRSIGIQRPEKFSRKMMKYIDLLRGGQPPYLG
jgi:hypothetical protein